MIRSKHIIAKHDINTSTVFQFFTTSEAQGVTIRSHDDEDGRALPGRDDVADRSVQHTAHKVPSMFPDRAAAQSTTGLHVCVQDLQCVRNCHSSDLKKRQHFEQPVIQT